MRRPRRMRRGGGPESFRPREMVAWFHPVEILHTAVRAVLAAVVTAYADARQAMTGASGLPLRFRPPAPSGPDAAPGPGAARDALRTDDVLDHADAAAEDGSYWFDYIADTGEGFDPTYAMACLLARRELEVEGLTHPLPRGQALILGGDQVYPWPSREAYRDRFVTPFRFAFPGPAAPDRAATPLAAGGQRPATANGEPLMAAIPGNHDWYDGLTAFLDVFCSGRRIGGWRTRQRRSYFGLRMPHGWALWAFDGQLTGRVDRNQVEYFRGLALAPDPPKRIIVAAPVPAWTHPRRRAWRHLRFFEEAVVMRPAGDSTAGPRIPVVLSGNDHFYARYEKADVAPHQVRHRIICGGGGAYTRGTGELPSEVRFLDSGEAGGTASRYVRAGPGFPDRITSRRLARGALAFPLLKHNLGFCAGFGILLFLALGYAGWASRVAPGEGLLTFLRNLPLAWGSLGDSARSAFAYLGRLAYLKPSVALLPALTVGGFTVFVRASNTEGSALPKMAAGLAYAALAWSLSLALLALTAQGLGGTWAPLVAHAVAGGFLAGTLMGIWLYVTNALWGWHNNEVYLCQSIRDYHSFLRCRIDPQGTLHIYPIGLRRVPKRWRRAHPGVAPLMEPVEQALRAHLIEPAITVPADPDGRSGADGPRR